LLCFSRTAGCTTSPQQIEASGVSATQTDRRTPGRTAGGLGGAV